MEKNKIKYKIIVNEEHRADLIITMKRFEREEIPPLRVRSQNHNQKNNKNIKNK